MSILLTKNNEMNGDRSSRRLTCTAAVLLGEGGDRRVAEAHDPSLIRIDRSLPDLTVLGAPRLLGRKNASPEASITAHPLESSREAEHHAGSCGFETKPVYFQRLLMRIASATPQVRT